MAAERITLSVYHEDGSEQEVIADQRDIVIAERELGKGFIKAIEDMPVTLFRHLGYSALRRTGALVPQSLSRADWEKAIVSVDPETDDDGEVGSADPTQPEAPAESPSTSPSRRSRASGKSASTGPVRT